jgi:hypothetical protein
MNPAMQIVSSFAWFVSCVTGSFIASRQVNRFLENEQAAQMNLELEKARE